MPLRSVQLAVRAEDWGSRKAAVLGTAVFIGLLAASGAQAQCVDTVPPVVTIKGPFPASSFIPLGQSNSVNSLVSVINSANTAFLSGTTAFVSAPGNPTPNQQGGGVWTCGIGGTVYNDNTGVVTIEGQPGSVVCQTKTKQDFAGFQIGRDIAQLNLDNSGWNAHVGLTGGWFEAHARDVSPNGSFTGDFEVPFAGLYAAATKGNFFTDGQVRWDFFDNTVSDPIGGLSNQQFNARSISVTGNVGYRYDITTTDRSKWFVEPSIGGVWSNTKVDPLNVSGTFVTTAASPGFPNNITPNNVSLPGTVQINDVESLLGRASVRVGTNFVSNNIAWQPFVTASVFREFAGDVTTTQTAMPGTQAVCSSFGIGCNATLTTSRVGTYGQFALGIAGQVVDTGWLGYARVDYRTGENIDGVSGNIGLRYQFNPGPTALPSLKGGPTTPIAPPVYNWTGFYAGGFAGGAEGRENWTFNNGAAVEPRFGGYLLGGQAGYNYQMGTWVIGVEGELGGSDASGGSSCPNLFLFTCETDVNWLASVTGRLGYAWGRSLFFVKGGLAAGEVAATTSFNTGSQPNIFGPPLGGSPVFTDKHDLIGWTVGTGAEFALAQNWSVVGDWMYYDLGSDTFVTPASSETVEAHGNTARVGINYHFR